MQIAQRYDSASVSTNLKDDEFHHQTEILAAMGMVSTHETCKLASKLYRVKFALDASSYNSLLEEWTEIVVKKKSNRKWPDFVFAGQIARLSLDHCLNDVCKICYGKGHLPLVTELGTEIKTVLSDDPCPACNGTSKRPIEAKHALVKYVEDMVEVLEKMIIHAGGEVIRKIDVGFLDN